MGWTYTFLKNHMNRKVLTSQPFQCLADNFLPYNFFENDKWMKGYALEKWESTLNFVFMPMDTM